MRLVPSAEEVSHEFMKGVSHEFMRHKTPDARKSLNPTLEREDFKRSKRRQEEHGGFRDSLRSTLPERSRRTLDERNISTKYTTGRSGSQEFDNMQDYNDCNPHPSQPYASDSDGGEERTPQQIQQWKEAIDRRYGKTLETERLTSAVLGKGAGSDSTDSSRK
jgi:hypothetical protein